MIKEITEQKETIHRALNQDEKLINRAADAIKTLSERIWWDAEQPEKSALPRVICFHKFPECTLMLLSVPNLKIADILLKKAV